MSVFWPILAHIGRTNVPTLARTELIVAPQPAGYDKVRAQLG